MEDNKFCNNDCENCDKDNCMAESDKLADDSIVTLIDEDTGEQYEFALVDDFEYKNKKYCVLLTLDEDSTEMLIAEINEDANGEMIVATLGDEDENVDEIYDYYDSLCDDYFEDIDEDESTKE